MAGEEKKFCFVISPIKDPGSLERKHADTVLEYIIRPALEPDYTVKRADEDQRPGQITNQMIRDIVDADLIVANLSGLNPNVMYALGIAHAQRKKVLHLVDQATQVPFDILNSRVIDFDVQDPVSHRVAASALQNHAHAVNAAEVVSNPFSDALAAPQAFDLEELKDLAVGDLMESMKTLQARVSTLEGHRTQPGLVNSLVRGAARLSDMLDTMADSEAGQYLKRLQDDTNIEAIKPMDGKLFVSGRYDDADFYGTHPSPPNLEVSYNRSRALSGDG